MEPGSNMGSVPGLFIIFVLVFLFNIFIYHGFSQPAWAVDVASKITDREIIESLSELKAGQKVIENRLDGMDKRIESLDKKIERLESIMLGGFGLLFTSMIGLVGFVLWDRRTALAPAIRKNKEMEEREDRLEKVLKEYAIEEPKLREILKRTGLL